MREFLADALLLGNCLVMVLFVVSVLIFALSKPNGRARHDRETQTALDRISAVGQQAQDLMLQNAARQMAARSADGTRQPSTPR